jgi:non-reducing end alpha-L-arabinofuranosidase
MRNNTLFISVIGLFLLGGGACTATSPSAGSGGSSVTGGGPGSGGVTNTGGQAGSGGATDSGGATGTGGSTGPVSSDKLPCDVYADDGGPCVAAHSTIRLLRSAYTGPLYQITRASDSTTQDITVLAASGLADSAAQDTFCTGTSCTMTIIYDQSGKGNHLKPTPAGGGQKPTADNPANAKALPITIAGNKVYGEHNAVGVGYRNNAAVGTATGDNEETIYMVVGGDYYNNGCCFDYGNAETNMKDNGEGTMEAVYFGNCTIWNKGGGAGPWIMGDLENGLWAGNASPYEGNPSVPASYKFVTGIVKGDKAGANHWAIKVGNAQSGGLSTPFDGTRPSSRYNPMRKEGAILLGTGGDNSNGATGNFFEGVMTAHYSSNAADDSVQANIASVYGQVQ